MSTKLQTRSCSNPTCSNTFEAYPSQPRKHCSQVCSWAHNGRPLALPSRDCLHCGTTYQPHGAAQKWCDDCRGGTKALVAKIRRYGISVPEWEAMKARHDGLCWICKEREADAVDHCHETDKVRGALCRICNMVLHYVERPGWWDAATSYLEGGDDDCG